MRGVTGGMLFGIPLLFTFEVWGIGAGATPPALALVLGVTFVPVSLLVHTGGFRRSMQVSVAAILREALEAVAVGIVSVAGVLVLLGEITPRTPAVDALGKIVYEAVPFAIGVAVARHVLAQSRDQVDGDTTGAEGGGHRGGTVADLGSTLVGAVFVAFNVAPTEEVPRLAAASSPPALLATVVVSLLISYGIVFEAGFADQARRRQQRGILQHPLTETVVAYLVALVASAVMLVLFRSIELGDPWPLVLDHVVLLGLPAAVGGAAGRLAI